MSERRESLVNLLHAIDRVHRNYPAVVLHAPRHEAGWSPLVDLTSLTAAQTQRVVTRMDSLTGWDATLPAPSPNLLKRHAEETRERQATRARDHLRRMRLH